MSKLIQRMDNYKNQVIDILKHIKYRVVHSLEELTCAYNLVYTEYLKRNYIKPHPAKMRILLHNILPETRTFIGMLENQIISTVTIIPDSPLGLPMDKLYKVELDALRRQGKKLCEISMLASNTDFLGEKISLMLNAKKMVFVFSLFKLIFFYAKDYLKADYMCITINPKHSLTYDFLLFQDLGGLKEYEDVNHAPAIAKYLDLTSIENRIKEKNRQDLAIMFLHNPPYPEQFSNNYVFSEEDLRNLFVEKTSLLTKCSPEALDYIAQCYPDYDFSKILKQ